MKSLNKVQLIGRVGQDPEGRAVGSKTVVNFSLATSWGTGDKERTEWHRIQAWEKVAEIVEQYVKKGDKLYVEGEIQYRTYTDKHGVEKSVTEIRAFNVILLGDKRETATAGAKSKPASARITDFDDDFGEDLPF